MQDLYNSLTEEEMILIYSLGALNGSPINSKTKFQKILFLVSNVFPDFKEIIEFEPHLLGPFSEHVEVIIDDLTRLGLINSRNYKYYLTERGLDLYSQSKPNKELLRVIEDFKEFLNDITDDELLTFIYVSFPDYTEEAVKWNKLKRKRVGTAISLLRKQKISFNKAVEIAGLSIKAFEDILVKRKVRWKQER